MRTFSIIMLMLCMILMHSGGVTAESQYKIVHKDQVTEDWEIHADYPLFERLENEEMQEDINHKIVQKLEDTFRMVKRGANETMGVSSLYYEETTVYKEKKFYSVVMTSHITQGDRYNSTVTSINFDDMDDGSIKMLNDFVHMDRLNNEVKKVLESDPDMYIKEPFAGVRDNTAYYLQEDHLVLVFNKFEIAAGVHGTPEIILPIEGLLKENIHETNVPFPSYT
ncbi:RsiV family protein [Halobacillus litoralis]|uniref:RsiV family protein n=1 Tax=Halobacillus litoralis TaxID=45668 RepID=UPI002492B5AD|nr:RsiV family protein [Halobacillus litoralis]